MDADGVGHLISAFWVHIVECLQAGDEETRRWLDTGDELSGFLWWCDVSEKNAGYWRKRLLRVWDTRAS